MRLDLYISDSVRHPTFEFDAHDASSASCGLDVVEVTREVDKPVYIGVYGHPRFKVGQV